MAAVRRLPEPGHDDVPWIDEPWNTATNAAFVVFSLMLLRTVPDSHPFAGELHNLLYLQICAGLASALHHANCVHHGHITIWLDWVPILLSFALAYRYRYMLVGVTWSSLLVLAVAVVILLVDHLAPFLPAPWGHRIWHVAAATGTSMIIADVIGATSGFVFAHEYHTTPTATIINLVTAACVSLLCGLLVLAWRVHRQFP
jgi:hypothetical protein